MDRNREARRSTIAATNGLARRRHRTTSLRESPEEDVAVELQETARLRDRGSGKKGRYRERDRFSRSKRRRAERLMHGNHREDVGDESSEESVNDEEDDENEDCGGLVRMLPPNPLSMTSISNHRKTFHPAKTFRTAATWRAADEMIGVSVPRKARSVSTKRSHDSWTPAAGVGSAELIHRQASTSPVRQTVDMAPAFLAPASPSSSNASARKKPKSNGPKLRPPKVSSKSFPAEEEIEIEIAEVLYGMMRQPQGPSKQDISVGDSRQVNKSTTDAKSRVSSPISNSSSALPLPSSIATQNSTAIVSIISTTAPKRKRPRPIKYEDENPSSFHGRNGPIFPTSKPETDHSAITEISSHNLKKSSGFLAENGRVSVNPASSETRIEHIKPEVNVLSDSKPLIAESNGKGLGVTKDEPQSPSNGTRDEMTSTEPHSSMAEFENQRAEKFQIDLMAPPSRSSPERNGEIDFEAVDPKSMVSDAEMEINKAKIKDDDKASKIGKEDEVINVDAKAKSEDADSPYHLAPDLDKAEPESGFGGLSNNKLNRLPQKQLQPSSISDKSGQASSLPLPMAVAGWPSGLPPMGYVSLPGVVSMDGSSVASTATIQPNLLFPPARPKRCATHFYIARNICYHQQIARMNPFWPAGPSAAPMFGAKSCNLTVLPSSEFHGNNLPGRSPSLVRDKAQSLSALSAQSGKDNKSPQPAAIVDASQRKQILVHQSLPPGAPTNILGPTFIFPMSQQQSSPASSRPGSVKSLSGGASASSGSASISGPAAIAGPPTMSFNYPNMPVNEAQYLAFLQNNGYSFPIPSHVGGPPGYRGAHPPPAMPFFNGSFYSSPMMQQGPPSSSVAGGGSSNQKHSPSQQPRAHSSGVYGGGGNLQGFPSSKNQASHPLPPPRPPPLESETGGEENPSEADRVSRLNMNAYGQNFPMPIHPPPIFTVINPPVPISGGGKRKHSQPRVGSKTGVEPAQAFALSFASSINGASTTTGIDSMSQNLPELTQQSYQFMAAAATQVAHPKKSYRDPDRNVDSSSTEDDRKTMASKTQNPTMVQSIAFSRPDLLDASSVSAIPGGSTMVDNLARRPSGSTNAPLGASNPQQQMQRNQQQMMLQKQQQFAAATARNKMPPASNGGGSVYTDYIPASSSMASFTQNLVQSNSTSPAQSPQWKNSVRATSQAPTQSISSTSSSTKNLSQQPNRPQQSHTQISFAANPKLPLQNQAQQALNGSQAPSPPSMVSSPTSSISKSSGGSPRLAPSTATGVKTGQAPTMPQHIKNSQPLPTQKSILGNLHGSSSSSSGGKTAQQPPQQHLSKQSLQQAQLFFSHPYMEARASHSTSPSAALAARGYYLQKWRPESSPAAPHNQSSTTSGGMLSLCSPVTLDPAKVGAGASAGNSPKTGGGLPAP